MESFLKIEKLLYRINATDQTKRKAWYYVLVRPRQLSAFKKKLLTGMLTISDYGDVIASGYGDSVPLAVQEVLEKRFGKPVS